MQEWQSLEQVEHTNAVAVELEVLSFRLALFCTSCFMRLASAPSTPFPGSAVFLEAFPCVDVDVRISHVTLACVFVAKGGMTSSSGTIGKLTVEQVFVGMRPSSIQCTWPSHRRGL